MRGMTEIDLTSLPAPEVIEPLDYELRKKQVIQSFLAEGYDFTAVLESDPAFRLIETLIYLEMIVRQRVNDAAKSVMLAFAGGGNLDQLAAPFGVKRLLLSPGDPDAFPPIAPVWEEDARFRRRITMAFDGYSTAGSEESYEFHVLSSSALVRDVNVTSPNPGEVVVSVLSVENDGIPDQSLLEIVKNSISGDKNRPLTDSIKVVAAVKKDYAIEAELILYNGPDSKVVKENAIKSIESYVKNHHILGNGITISSIHAALSVPGVHNVLLRLPKENIILSSNQFPFCTNKIITVSNIDG